MIQQTTPDISVLSLRKAELIDADKARYLVYRTPKDFVAVIAESALMAIKVSGVTNPHRVVRDLPTSTVAIDAERMVKVAAAEAPKVSVSIEHHTPNTEPLIVRLREKKRTPAFAPMTVGDFKAVWEKKYEAVHEKENRPASEPQFDTVEPPPKEAATEAVALEEATTAVPPAADGVLSPEEIDRLLTS